MKTLILVDKSLSAIDRLAQEVKRYYSHYKIQILPIHPKKNTGDDLYRLENALKWCDVLDVHYWKSGEIARSSFPREFEKKKKILFHFNPYDLDKQKWNDIYDLVVVGNVTMHNKLPYAYHIPYGINLDFFKFNPTYTEENRIVNMVVGRIESNKKVLEVAKACKEIGAQLQLIGRVSSGPYMQQILDTGAVRFWENASEEELYRKYLEATIHVCNSVDNFESGTLPIMEAMAVGVPVLTRSTGHVPDLHNGKNMQVRNGTPDNMEDLKENLLNLLDNKEWRLKLRDAAWNTIKNYSSEIMARRIVRLYYKMYEPEKPSVSVVIPTKDNPKTFITCLVSILTNNYSKFEVLVSDSGDMPVERIIKAAREKTDVPIKYIYFTGRNHTLAEARNRAVVEATGEVLIFCDDRLKMEKDTIDQFAKMAAKNTWIWGVKDDSPKSFVENLSAVMREDLVKGGMFNERIDCYGGTTQDIKSRFDVDFILINEARAYSITRTKGKNSRRDDIRRAKLLLQKLYE